MSEYVPIPFGPKGCVDARLDIRKSWLPGGFNIQWRSNPEHANDDQLIGQVTDVIASADLYWIAPDMCDLIASASTSVPTESSLLPELIPIASGIAFLTHPIAAEAGLKPAPASVIRWEANDGYIEIETYSHHAKFGFVAITESHWRYERRLDDNELLDGDVEIASAFEDRRTLLALFALLASPGVASVERQKLDWSTIKRSRRGGVDVSEIRVIYLRSPKRSANETAGETGRYQHRWIVDGHWRSQPYGPGNAFRKPVWIAPHVKGPTGAPLLGGDKVRAVVR